MNVNNVCGYGNQDIFLISLSNNMMFVTERDKEIRKYPNEKTLTNNNMSSIGMREIENRKKNTLQLEIRYSLV